MKLTLPILAWSLLVSLCLSLVSWFVLVLQRFTPPDPQWLTLATWLQVTFADPVLRWVALESLAIGFIPVWLLLYLLGDGSDAGERVLRGARLVTGKQLAKLTRRKPAGCQVVLAGVPIPLACEPSHVLLAGSTNTGKSVAIDGLLASALARGDRCIVIDPNGHALARFGRKGDVLLNPFDRRGPGWGLFNEVRKDYDFERLAASVVPDSADAGSQVWHGYARQLLAETMRAMAQNGETSTERLLYWLTQASAETLGAFLVGSAASGQFESGAEKALASTRFILAHHLGPYQHLRDGEFSLRTWLESGTGNLYLPWRQDMLAALKPLISGWVDILMASVLTLPTDHPRPLWLVLDELASLERLSSLEAALTKGRKHGLRVVAGLQSVAQLDALYGQHNANTLRSCFRNLLALGCSSADPATAKVIAEGLGQVEVERTQTTHNQGQAGNTKSTTQQRSIDDLVLPSELTALEPLNGYLKLAGNLPVARIHLQPRDTPVCNKPFVERTCSA